MDGEVRSDNPLVEARHAVPLQEGGPRLSVIVPTHNRAELLEKCLAGLELQTFKDFEAVVAVDGSTDGTLPLLASLKRRNPYPISDLYLTQGGQARARNEAIRVARGQIVVFCDDDVVLGPETLARHAAFHDVFEASVAIGPVTYEGGRTHFPARPSWVNLTGMNASLPRQAAIDAGLFDESLSGWGGEDLEFGYRLTRAGLRFRPLAGADARHLAPWARSVEKARSAGRQAVLIAAKHGSDVSLQLGVHPALLNVKRAYLNPFFDRVVGWNANYAFERAYQQGAQEAMQELQAASDESAEVAGSEPAAVAEDDALIPAVGARRPVPPQEEDDASVEPLRTEDR